MVLAQKFTIYGPRLRTYTHAVNGSMCLLPLHD